MPGKLEQYIIYFEYLNLCFTWISQFILIIELNENLYMNIDLFHILVKGRNKITQAINYGL